MVRASAARCLFTIAGWRPGALDFSQPARWAKDLSIEAPAPQRGRVSPRFEPVATARAHRVLRASRGGPVVARRPK
ncbi:protein of unknown function [Paraburkholderia kururiensis]